MRRSMRALFSRSGIGIACVALPQVWAHEPPHEKAGQPPAGEAAHEVLRLPAEDRPASLDATLLYRVDGVPQAGDRPFRFVPKVAFDAQDNLYVWDAGNRRVVVFGRDGRYVRTADPAEPGLPAGLTAELGSPSGSRWDVLPSGELLLNTSVAYRIEIVDRDGQTRYVLERPLAVRFASGTDGVAGPDRHGVGHAIRWLRVDPVGRIWIARNDDPTSPYGPIDVIDTGGRYVGTLAAQPMPATFSLSGRIARIQDDGTGGPGVVVEQLHGIRSEDGGPPSRPALARRVPEHLESAASDRTLESP